MPLRAKKPTFLHTLSLTLDPAAVAVHDHYTRRQHKLDAMDPNLMFLLDEPRFDDHDAKWERRFADLDD